MTSFDFTSSGCLGYRHGPGELASWPRLTTGRPAILGDESGIGARLVAHVARQTGRNEALLEVSTLHAFVDVWSVLGSGHTALLVDAAAYPVGVMALRASTAVRSVETVAHFEVEYVARTVRRLPPGLRPVLLVDGLCPDCGRLAPLPGYLSVMGPRGGMVVVDDTQSLGLIGPGPRSDAPFGDGGGGAAARQGVSEDAPLVVVASTAKAFGAPLAVVAGPAALIDEIRRAGPCQVHSSAPSAAAEAALQNAVTDAAGGAARRRRLAGAARLFRELIKVAGLETAHSRDWPMQIVLIPGRDVISAYIGLRRRGVRAVPVRRRCQPGTGLAFLLTADHPSSVIVSAVRLLEEVLAS
ncbi:MAG: 8-amino-7-oxononanoate synthase [Actinomycetota bacterium]|nr:8-amino-7-oxononanoate synthase [Actinomycetota bacterium]